MEILIQQIYDIIKDYHCDREQAMSIDKVNAWILQFEESDREFILEEFLHLLNQGIYLSKEKAKEKLWEGITHIANAMKYTNIELFFRDSKFLKLQEDFKSQSVLLGLLDEMLKEKIGITLADCGILEPKFYIYIDDILGTGGSFYNNISKFLKEEGHIEKVTVGNSKLISFFHCIHTWGENNVRIRLKIEFSNKAFLDEKQFPIFSSYRIENNIMDFKQRVNLAYPIETIKCIDYDEFISRIESANRNFHLAYRKVNTPINETFFTNPINRIKFEKIILEKGLKILSSVETLKPNHRPLGMTNPSNQTFGTGTMFFTWRNISNTCPIVFWWEGHNWTGLFPLINRGIKK
jgi:hypothetical protein